MGKIEKARALWRDRENQLRYIRWLSKYSKPYLGRIFLVMFLSILESVIALAMALVSKEIIDNATAGGRSRVLVLIGVYFGMILITQAMEIVLTLVRAMLSERFSFGIRKQIYEKILTSQWLSIQKYHTGDLMTRLTSDAGAIADGIIGTIPEIISLVLELVMVFFTLFYYSPLLAVFALLIAPVAVLAAGWLGKKLKAMQVRVLESESAYRSFLQESIANLMIMKTFANEEYASEKLVDLREKRFYWVFKKTKFSLFSATSMSMSFQLGYIAAFTYGALQVSAGAITYGTMSVFLTLVNRVQAPVMQLAQQIPRAVSVLASAGRVIELQNVPSENYGDVTIDTEKLGLKAEHVSFGYTEEEVLSDVSLKVEPGEMIAVVGESGIGKTTLIRLAMSFLQAGQGSLSYYDSEGREQQVNGACRRFISYVPQGNTLFSGTIKENIRMGRLDATEEEMLEALKLASGYEFVQKLPKGLDTVIGERGHGLSEGQAQRIAIARALVRKAPFLILDEATSALDEATELKVLEGVRRQEPKPTCILITHRRSVLQYCDREIRIENKKVISPAE